VISKRKKEIHLLVPLWKVEDDIQLWIGLHSSESNWNGQ